MQNKTCFYVIVFFAFFLWSPSNVNASEHTGKKLNNFKLKTLAGEKIRIRSVLKDKPAVINFTTTWCEDCKKLDEIISRSLPKYSKKGVVFCYVYVGQKKKFVLSAIAEKSPNPNIIKLLDERRKIFQKMKLNSVPHLLIVNSKGIIGYEGAPLDEKDFIAAIEKVLMSDRSIISH